MWENPDSKSSFTNRAKLLLQQLTDKIELQALQLVDNLLFHEIPALEQKLKEMPSDEFRLALDLIAQSYIHAIYADTNYDDAQKEYLALLVIDLLSQKKAKWSNEAERIRQFLVQDLRTENSTCLEHHVQLKKRPTNKTKNDLLTILNKFTKE